MEREVLEFDVQFVGAGPAGLAGAIHLANLIEKHNAAVAAGGEGAAIPETTIAVLEKSARVGAHGISGAVLDPRGLNELVPDWRERGCPVAAYRRADTCTSRRRKVCRTPARYSTCSSGPRPSASARTSSLPASVPPTAASTSPT